MFHLSRKNEIWNWTFAVELPRHWHVIMSLRCPCFAPGILVLYQQTTDDPHLKHAERAGNLIRSSSFYRYLLRIFLILTFAHLKPGWKPSFSSVLSVLVSHAHSNQIHSIWLVAKTAWYSHICMQSCTYVYLAWSLITCMSQQVGCRFKGRVQSHAGREIMAQVLPTAFLAEPPLSSLEARDTNWLGTSNYPPANSTTGNASFNRTDQMDQYMQQIYQTSNGLYYCFMMTRTVINGSELVPLTEYKRQVLRHFTGFLRLFSRSHMVVFSIIIYSFLLQISLGLIQYLRASCMICLCFWLISKGTQFGKQPGV